MNDHDANRYLTMVVLAALMVAVFVLFDWYFGGNDVVLDPEREAEIVREEHSAELEVEKADEHKARAEAYAEEKRGIDESLQRNEERHAAHQKKPASRDCGDVVRRLRRLGFKSARCRHVDE